MVPWHATNTLVVYAIVNREERIYLIHFVVLKYYINGYIFPLSSHIITFNQVKFVLNPDYEQFIYTGTFVTKDSY